MLILITRQVTPSVEAKLRSLVRSGIDAYVMSDEEPTIHSKRILHYPDSLMEEIGWTHHMSQVRNKITAWDKATYHAHKSGNDYVWIMEDDVFWNKPIIMKEIVNTSSRSDLIAYPLAESYRENPNWHHWDKVQMITPTKKYWTATYNQLCRLSRRLLDRIADLSTRRHRLFFHEGMFATLCNMNVYSISYLDKPEYINIRWDKPFTKEQISALIEEHKYVLLHPVKMD